VGETARDATVIRASVAGSCSAVYVALKELGKVRRIASVGGFREAKKFEVMCQLPSDECGGQK
jgi:hypothetical protein